MDRLNDLAERLVELDTQIDNIEERYDNLVNTEFEEFKEFFVATMGEDVDHADIHEAYQEILDNPNRPQQPSDLFITETLPVYDMFKDTHKEFLTLKNEVMKKDQTDTLKPVLNDDEISVIRGMIPDIKNDPGRDVEKWRGQGRPYNLFARYD